MAENKTKPTGASVDPHQMGKSCMALAALLTVGVSCAESAAPPVPAQLSLATAPTSSPQSRVAFPVQPAVQLLDASGSAVAVGGIAVTASIVSGGGLLTGAATATTSGNGVAAFTDLAIGGTVGARTLRFAAPGLDDATADVTLVAGLPATVQAASAQEQAGSAGTAVVTLPAVAIADADGNPTPAVTATFAVTAGGGSVTGAQAISNASGVATVGSWTLGAAAGTNMLSATVAGAAGSPVVFTATGAGVPSSLLIVRAPSATSPNRVALAAQPELQVLDAEGEPLGHAGIEVAASIESGGGTLLGDATAMSDADGVARFTDLAIAGTAGDRVLEFAAEGLTAATATVSTTHGDPSAVTLHAGDAQTAAVGATLAVAPAVRVADVDGNGVPGVSVSFAIRENAGEITGGTQVTSADGVAAVGSWRLGWIGTHRLVAAVAVPEDSITFSATGTAPVLAQQSAGLSGHLSAAANQGAPPAGFAHGFSAYGTVHAVTDVVTKGTQFGWGTWLRPDNRAFGSALCPTGTTARDFWPERGPTWWEVYQSIEGGLGSWANTQFPSLVPKFRLNVTPDCYSNQVASTGWHWGGTEPLPERLLIVGQLSNRVIVPPDGITMTPPASHALLGYAWIALPLIPAMTSQAGEPTGDQSWTLFLHASNFRGPVAFYTPEAFSAINAGNAVASGRGLDVLPGFFDAVAVEVGNAPTFTGTDSSGTRYRRIPRLTYPVDASGKAVIQQDVRNYSKDAIWTRMKSWIDSGYVADAFDPAGSMAATLDWSHFQVHFGGEPVVPNSAFNAGVIQTSAGGPALGYTWGGGIPAGVFPEYYREEAGNWHPVPVEEVPRETWLIDQTFETMPRGAVAELSSSSASPWSSAKWAAGPFTATLSDGSTVEYVWYRFVDQPAIARLGLAADVLDRLQAFAESFHAHADDHGPSIPPPTAGTLVALDPAVIVRAPAGFEQGYVPIVIGQR